MNDSSLFNNEHRTIESRPPLGEDLLPPVEPPSARFIIQLFVVPALIVALIVAVWLAFNWLVRSTELGPDQLIQGIEQGPNVARWQRARELADMLQDKRYPEFRQSHKSAGDLARMLDRELDQAETTEDAIEFRKYLARGLGRIRCARKEPTYCSKRRRRIEIRPTRRCAMRRSKRSPFGRTICRS